MPKEYPEKANQRSKACDFQKLKQLENNSAVRKLRDTIEQLNFRLAERKNENHMLKRNLQLAKKMVYQEVGGHDIDFQALIKNGTEAGSKSRQEALLLLKMKVEEMKDYLKELEGDQPQPQETPSKECMYQMSTNRKRLWRMELDRRLAKKDAEKDINPLVQESFELRKNLDAEKNRFKDLKEEVELLRRELQSQVEKNEADTGIMNSFNTLETQLEKTLSERAGIRNDLAGSRACNKKLTEEIETVKEELQTLQKKNSDCKALIDSLTSSHKNIQEAIDAEKVIVQQNIERYKTGLKVLRENHAINIEMLDHLQSVIYERNEMIDELKRDAQTGIKSTDNEKKPEDGSKANVPKVASKESETLQPITAKSATKIDPAAEDPAIKAGRSDAELEVQKLRLQGAKYKALCDAAVIESKCLTEIIVNQETKMKEVAVQVVEAGRLIMQKNVEKKDQLAKVNRFQKSLSSMGNHCRKAKPHVQPKRRIEDLRLRTDAQREENDFLRKFLCSVLCDKAKNVQSFKSIISLNKHFFLESMRQIQEQLEADPNENQSNQ